MPKRVNVRLVGSAADDVGINDIGEFVALLGEMLDVL